MPAIVPSVQPGEGTKLEVMLATVLTPVAQVYEIDGPETLVEAIDISDLTKGIIVTRPSLFPEPDTVSIKVWFDPNDIATHKLFVTDVTTPGAVEAWTITFNDGNATHATATFSGFITSFKLNGAKLKSNIGADIEIKCTTLIVFNPGT
jgi:hypothetical protein